MPRKKLNIVFIKKSFATDGYRLLTKVYKNSEQKLDYICPKKHKYSISWNDWKRGRRCPYCAGRIKLTVEFIKREFEKEEYQLLTDVYKNAHQKLDTICNKGHKWSVSWANFQQGYRCSACSGNRKKSIEEIKEQFKKEGYRLLSEKYRNAHQKLYAICPNSHKWSVSWNNFKTGKRCARCKYIKQSQLLWKGGKKVAWYDTYAHQISWCEEVRRDPINRNYLQVRCTESSCRKWFNPTRSQVLNRIMVLIGKSEGELRFYCSEKCKQACSIYWQGKYPKWFKHNYSREVQRELSKLVFKRDNYECQRCGNKKNLQAHHYESIYQNPIESADIDMCVTLCRKCHKLAHKDIGCRYIDLTRRSLCTESVCVIDR